VLSLEVQNSYRDRYRELAPGWRPSGEQLEALVRSRLTPQSRVLDLGCGRGGVVEVIRREVALAAGLDSDAASLAEHRASGLPLVQSQAEHIPFIDESFDLVVSIWVLEHLREPEKVMREVRRVLRPGGHFVFLTPNLRHPLLRMNRLGSALPMLQRKLVPRIYGRSESDTFRVAYRANTVDAIRTQAARGGLEVVELRVVSDPTYLALSPALFRASVWSERLLPRGWGIHLLGDLGRPA
jgi:SAM-dependent methyltransferase